MKLSCQKFAKYDQGQKTNRYSGAILEQSPLTKK